MDKISGLVLDYYDDVEGIVAKEVGDSLGSVDDLVKSAHVLSPEELGRLPESVCALTLVEGDLALKKFAMVDEANTRLSIGYFIQTGHKLPEEAQKVAAQNLLVGCDWYGIKPPEELQKLALGIGTLIGAATVLPGAASEARKNLRVARGAGGTILTPEQLQAQRVVQGV